MKRIARRILIGMCIGAAFFLVASCAPKSASIGESNDIDAGGCFAEYRRDPQQRRSSIHHRDL